MPWLRCSQSKQAWNFHPGVEMLRGDTAKEWKKGGKTWNSKENGAVCAQSLQYKNWGHQIKVHNK